MLKTGGFTPHFQSEIDGVSKVLSDVARRSLTACQHSLLAQPHFARGPRRALLPCP
jgi:hypothetical protein